MQQTRKAYSLRAFCGLVVMTCSGWALGRAMDEDHSTKDVMWLVDGTRNKPFIGCGNSGEFSGKPQFGIIINDDGEIVEQISQGSWVRQISDKFVLLSTQSYSGAIPKRTLISDDHRIAYESDLVPKPIGNGWIVCSDGYGLWGGQSRTRLSDGRVVDNIEYFYFDDQLERVMDIGHRLGIDLRGNQLIGFIEPSGIPVVQEPGTNLQRIVKEDGNFSEHAFYQIDIDRRFIHHDSFVSAQSIPQRWLYIPINNKKVLAFW